MEHIHQKEFFDSFNPRMHPTGFVSLCSARQRLERVAASASRLLQRQASRHRRGSWLVSGLRVASAINSRERTPLRGSVPCLLRKPTACVRRSGCR